VVCACVRVSACVYVCVRTCTYGCVFIYYGHVCMYVHLYLCEWAYVDVLLYTHVSTHACLSVRTCVLCMLVCV
jgi:hypothetical protein